MNTFGFVAFVAIFSAASAGLIAPTTNIIQLPSSRTTLLGPDGSIISSGEPLITNGLTGTISSGLPVISTPILTPDLHSAPIFTSGSASLIGERLVGEGSLISGPSGSISTTRTLGASGLTGLVAPHLISSPGVIAARSQILL